LALTGRPHRRLAHLALRPALAVALAVAMALLGFGAVTHVHAPGHDCDGGSQPANCFWCVAAALFVFLPMTGPVLVAMLRASLRLPAAAAVRAWSHPVGLSPSRAPPAA
jgi:hypothetical protein